MWRKVESPTTSDLYKVFALSEEHVWITVREENIVFRLNKGIWEEWSTKDTGLHGIRGIYALAPWDVWLVGTASDNNYIAHWNGKKWERYKLLDSTPLQDIQMLSSQLGWAVGFDGLILQWDGEIWHKIPSPTKFILNSIHMLSPTEGCIVGHYGTILQYNKMTQQWILAKASGFWTRPNNVNYEQEETQDFLAVKMISPNEIWCAGINGTITHYAQGKWTTISGPNSDGFSVLPSGKLIYWFEEGWDTNFPRISSHINSLHAINNKVWAGIGNWGDKDKGEIISYNGASWHKNYEIPNQTIYSIHMLSEKSGWAVGKDGLILRWQS